MEKMTKIRILTENEGCLSFAKSLVEKLKDIELIDSFTIIHENCVEI